MKLRNLLKTITSHQHIIVFNNISDVDTIKPPSASEFLRTHKDCKFLLNAKVIEIFTLSEEDIIYIKIE